MRKVSSSQPYPIFPFFLFLTSIVTGLGAFCSIKMSLFYSTQEVFYSLEEGCISKYLSSCLMAFQPKNPVSEQRSHRIFSRWCVAVFDLFSINFSTFSEFFWAPFIPSVSCYFSRVYTLTCESVRRSKAESIQIPAAPAKIFPGMHGS